MSITIKHEELSLEDLDTDDINITHALCAYCYPDDYSCSGDFPPEARYLCGKQIEEPVDGECCVVCVNIAYCPECGEKLTSQYY